MSHKPKSLYHLVSNPADPTESPWRWDSKCTALAGTVSSDHSIRPTRSQARKPRRYPYKTRQCMFFERLPFLQVTDSTRNVQPISARVPRISNISARGPHSSNNSPGLVSAGNSSNRLFVGGSLTLLYSLLFASASISSGPPGGVFDWRRMR